LLVFSMINSCNLHKSYSRFLFLGEKKFSKPFLLSQSDSLLHIICSNESLFPFIIFYSFSEQEFRGSKTNPIKFLTNNSVQTKLLGYQITIRITLPRLVQIAKFQFTLATCSFNYTSQAKQFQLQYHDLVSVIKHILYDEMLSFFTWKN
jgi:hypothetical protein